MHDPSPPWLSIIGIGEGGLADLVPAARAALEGADSVFGAPRHLALAGIDAHEPGGRSVPWPVPFSVAPLLARRGAAVAALVSNDPFWFGAGAVLARALPAAEWRAFPAPSGFSLAAARLGWALEEIPCLGLHAAPLGRLVPHLAAGARLFCLLRDGAAAGGLAEFLTARGFGESRIHLLEALGGPRARHRVVIARESAPAEVAAPVMAALEIAGGPGLPLTPGLSDTLFAHDGQITKAPIRALTLAALAPRRGETLWDIGAGSGSVAVEWCRAGGAAFAIEQNPARAANIRANAAWFGLEGRLVPVEGRAPEILEALPSPDAAFIGGGAGAALIAATWARLAPSGRLVVNAVTLETEALVIAEQAARGGMLTRIEIAQAAPLGGRRGWEPARPIIQWSAVR